MESKRMWEVFLRTGAPEDYLRYRRSVGKERACTRKPRG